ncbi:MAG TPA: hypothetical protein DEQ28_06380 [Clostridiales bacterium]|nr:hypothetical protein [Clostridiales bacterium]
MRAMVVRPILPTEQRARDELMALLGWGAAVLACGPRDQWIGRAPERRWQRLRFVVNNQRFLVLPGARGGKPQKRLRTMSSRSRATRPLCSRT